MDILQQSASTWKNITEYRYLFTYGYKKHLYPINLTFSLEDYPHLAGFQYMKDVSIPNFSSAKVADRILEGKITLKQMQTALCHECTLFILILKQIISYPVIFTLIILFLL